MRVGYLGPLPPIRGGIAQHGENLLRAVQDLGHQLVPVSWASQYPNWAYPGTQAPASGPHHTLKWWSPLSWHRARRRLSTCDLVIVPWVTPHNALPLRWVLGGCRGVKVAIVHNPLPHERTPLARPLTRWVMKLVDRAVVHADTVAAQLRNLVPGVRTTVMPHPPNLALAPTPLPPRPPLRLLFFGYVREYKGLDVLLDAVAATNRELDLRLTAAGECWDDADGYRTQAIRLGIDDIVDLRFEYVGDEEVGALFASHHLVVQPYRSATQSGVIPLAFAAGRPVVVTPVGGLAELVIDGENGAVTTDTSVAAVAEAIKRCAVSLEDLAAGAAAATASWEVLAGEVVNMVSDA